MNEEKIFLDYAKRYDSGVGKIALKTEHSLKTAEVMDELTSELDLSAHLRDLAHASAVFHDTGRFEQVKQYNTFRDEISVDHAHLGCLVLKEEGMLDYLSEEDRKKVLTSIENHNKYTIEDGLDEETLLLCRLIRDADKIDILRVFATDDPVDTMGETAEAVAQERISDEVYERIMAHKEIPKSIRQTGLDRWVGFLGFLYGLCFEESKRIIKKQGYYRQQFDRTVFTRPETANRVHAMLDDIEEFLK